MGEGITAVAREHVCGHAVSLAMREHAIMEMFSSQSMQWLYNMDQMPL
jgi:hypothetical protein